ncbi:MAG: type IV secretion system DNA-binding domain-containing protein [Clostridia bacterium]|nr:type IV secretion system DNA-binding domain-containing protein [Clostridia bacterium]
MEPLLKQLIKQDSPNLGMLILDVKGNFYKTVKKYSEEYDRLDSLIIIELGSNVKYNPLDKPNLKPSVLANRLKTILELFSSNNSDSYWLDKSEQVITEAIKLCRLYNNGYVTFVELHNLINYDDYFQTKIEFLRKAFQSGTLSHEKIYDLYSSLNFFENEFKHLDSRTLSIIKSEITRITSTFISDYDILSTFCPDKSEINFFGFKSLIRENKIVVLNMNIARYKNLSKIIAAYLKLDFQSEVLIQLSNKKTISPTVFMCDEYHEYVTLSDSDFFAQSREAKCINIVATQSYTSLLNTLKDESSVKVILQNLVNKLWLRTDDIFTIESAQKQIGREDKIKYSKNISENAGETNYNYFTNSLESKKSNISESISTQIHTDFVYDTNFFTQNLKTFSCLAFLSDGTQILPPRKIDLFPSFLDITDKKISSSNKII